jgi:small subunit ribosomal protein S9
MATAKTTTTPDSLGTGRRKTAVARVRLRAGDGKILINKRPMVEYFCHERDRNSVMAPFTTTGSVGKFDVAARVEGGGPTGQAEAVLLGIARALKRFDPSLEPALREHHLLTRDDRKKERKKYGLHGARRGTQFSKR